MLLGSFCGGQNGTNWLKLAETTPTHFSILFRDTTRSGGGALFRKAALGDGADSRCQCTAAS
jgi:hypothetical protein